MEAWYKTCVWVTGRWDPGITPWEEQQMVSSVLPGREMAPHEVQEAGKSGVKLDQKLLTATEQSSCAATLRGKALLTCSRFIIHVLYLRQNVLLFVWTTAQMRYFWDGAEEEVLRLCTEESKQPKTKLPSTPLWRWQHKFKKRKRQSEKEKQQKYRLETMKTFSFILCF